MRRHRISRENWINFDRKAVKQWGNVEQLKRVWELFFAWFVWLLRLVRRVRRFCHACLIDERARGEGNQSYGVNKVLSAGWVKVSWLVTLSGDFDSFKSFERFKTFRSVDRAASSSSKISFDLGKLPRLRLSPASDAYPGEHSIWPSGRSQIPFKLESH